MEKCSVCGKPLSFEYKKSEKDKAINVCIPSRNKIKNANLILSRKMYNRYSSYFACFVDDVFCIVDKCESSPVSNDLDRVIKECIDDFEINDDTIVIYRDSVRVWSGILLKNRKVKRIYEIKKPFLLMLDDINKAVMKKIKEDKIMSKKLLKKTHNNRMS